MNAMQQALNTAGVEPSMFRKYTPLHPIHHVPTSPLVVESEWQQGERRLLIKARKAIFPVRHITMRKDGKRFAVTNGGDMWPFINKGNNYLVATR